MNGIVLAVLLIYQGHCLGSTSNLSRALSWQYLFGLDVRAQELCESRGGRPGLPVPNSPYGPCGRKATLNLNWSEWLTCVGFCGKFQGVFHYAGKAAFT